MRVELKGESINADLELQPITQICGMNVIRKKDILEEVANYFSTYKYTDKESVIYVDGEEVGRKYFFCIYVKNKDDILKYISLTKTSLMYKYFAALMQDFDIQESMYKIDDYLLGIYGRLNALVSENIGNIQFNYELQEAWSLLQKSNEETMDGNDISDASNYELLEILTNMICQSNYLDLGKILLIVENIDHLLDKNEYVKYLDLLSKKDIDLWTILTTSLPNYVKCINKETEGIISINNLDYCVEDFCHIKDFVKEYYPINKEFCDDDLIQRIEESVNEFGTDTFQMEKEVMVRLFNNMLGINTKHSGLKQPEIAYLFEKNMV